MTKRKEGTPQFATAGDENIILTIKNKRFICKNRHTYFANSPTFVIASAENERGGYVELRKINICPVCYVEWIEKNVPPAEEVKDV